MLQPLGVLSCWDADAVADGDFVHADVVVFDEEVEDFPGGEEVLPECFLEIVILILFGFALTAEEDVLIAAEAVPL